MKALTLDAKTRLEVCYHEAAHAVVHALGGASVFKLAVAPVGSTDWEIENRKGFLISDAWGVCESSTPPSTVLMNIHWDDEKNQYIANRKNFSAMVKSIAGFLKNYRNDLNRVLRAQICGNLAGPIATGIFYDQEACLESSPCKYQEGGDIAFSIALSMFLPQSSARELLHAKCIVKELLQTPSIWTTIQTLALALERQGEMDSSKLEPFLPEQLDNWPNGPGPRKS